MTPPLEISSQPQPVKSPLYVEAPVSIPETPVPVGSLAPKEQPGSAETMAEFTIVPSAPASESEPSPQPTAEPAPPVQPAAAEPAPADTHRVDDLLRQFRERYGRGSL